MKIIRKILTFELFKERNQTQKLERRKKQRESELIIKQEKQREGRALIIV